MNTKISDLQGSKKIIREVKESDASPIASIYRYYVENTTITFEVVAPTVEEMCGRIRKNRQKYPWIVLEDDGVLIGYAYACAFRERISYRFTVEISVYLTREHQWKGYGGILMEALLEELRQKGFYTAIAGITATNGGSICFFEKLGFKPCAKFVNVGYKNGEWLSVMMLLKELQPEFVKTPAEPVYPIRY